MILLKCHHYPKVLDLSIKFNKYINNIVDKEKSEYYFINKRKRNFWHSKSQSITCRVREKNDFNHGPGIAKNIRAFLLNEDKLFKKEFNKVIDEINKKDQEEIQKYVISIVQFKHPSLSKEEIIKNIGLYVKYLDQEEIKAALNLNEMASCRLIGYEKELFYLKCYTYSFLPVFVMRCLYHTKYNHSDFEIEYDTDLNDPLEFNDLLDKITFS